MSTMLLKFIAFVAAFFVLASLWGFYISIRPRKIVSPLTPKDLGLIFEEVSFQTQDGLTLRGWWIPARKGEARQGRPQRNAEQAKTVVLLHGYPADKGNILPPMAFLADHYNLFLFDFRYLGESGGLYTTAGAKEVADLLAAIEFLKKRGINEVGVWGFSMGGAVALMAAPLAPEIKAIVSEASYARLDLMAAELYQIPGLRHLLGFLVRVWGKVLLGIDVRRVSPEDTAPTLTNPILIIHSANDEVIPFSHALRIQKALKHNPRAEFWFRKNIFHGQLLGEYQIRVKEFFGQHL